MKCLVNFWKAQGIKMSVFIDYGLGSVEKEQVKRDIGPTIKIAKAFPMNKV